MASAYLSQNLPSNQNSLHKWTYSGWVKRTELGNETYLFNFYTDNNNRGGLRFNTDDTLIYYERYGGSTVVNKTTNRVFRDTSAWYHIMVAVDKSVSSPDTQIYINGVEETSFSTDNDYTQNETTKINDTNTVYINSYDGSLNIYDQIQTHVHWVSGYKLTPTSFGETDSTSGIWKPKTAPSVTYGTNGFFLKMENSSDMGEDSSGNNNDFTTSGTITQTEDTPSNNFATLNALYFSASGLTISNGNLSITGNSSSAWRSLPATLGVSSGKWYYEAKIKSFSTGLHLGIIDYSQVPNSNAYAYQYSRAYMYKDDGNKANNNTSSSYGNSFTTGDIIGVAMDLDNNKIYFSKNGTFQNSGDPTSGATGTGSAFDITSGYNYTPVFSTNNTSDQIEFNFGNGRFGTTALASSNSDGAGLGLFEYSVPSGYYALCTKNIKNYG